MNTYFKIQKKNFFFIISSIFFILLNNILFYKYLGIYKNILNILLFFILTFLFQLTKIGKKIILFIIRSKLEIKNIIWPSIKDVTKMVLIIFFLSVLISLVMWLIDNFIIYLISMFTDLRFL